MLKFLLVFVFIGLLAVGAGYSFGVYIVPEYLSSISVEPPKIRDIKELASLPAKETMQKAVSMPPPLRGTQEIFQSTLTQTGVTVWTNIQRASFGLPSLVGNVKLNAAAAAKVQDMFDNQYFAHVSPSGTEVGDIIEVTGYEYILVGENLALGNFKDDRALVEAWMDSPGHKENILNSSYTEIGVAVAKGTFEGKTTWLAVQEFGLPISVCPQSEDALAVQIDAHQALLDELEGVLDKTKTELQHMRPRQRSVYNKKVQEYNALVGEYNDLVSETKALVAAYNSQVQAFNQCAQQAIL